MDAILPTVPAATPHTHGEAAAARTAANLFVERFGRLLGRRVFYYQMSAADQRHERLGSRDYRWVKDLNAEARPETPESGDLLALIDVDHYVDMPQFLNEHDGNVILFTFQPKVACAEREEYSFTFGSDQRVSYQVTGGGSYCHRVWNWSTDNIIVSTGSWWSCDAVTTAYLVDRREVDQDHELVNLSPVGRWTGFWAWLATWVEGTVLQHLTPADGKYIRLRCTGGSPKVSTGIAGTHLCATVPSSVDAAVGVASRVSGVKLTVAQTQAVTGLDRNEASVLTEYYRECAGTVQAEVYQPQVSVRSYQFGRTADLDFDAKPAMVPFMAPLVYNGYVPVCSKSNDERMVKARITSLASKATATPLMFSLMDEFVDRLIPDEIKGMGLPTDLDEVWERQARPAQRRILEEADLLDAAPLREASSFMKKEAYGEVKDPRPITTINGVDKRDYSTFCYAFAEHLKKMPWYAFGKTPQQVADRMAEVCMRAVNHVNLTDLSRCDGRISSAARDLERIAMVRFFQAQFHARMIELMRSQFNLRGRTRFGIRYWSWFARFSGSPETSIFNTLVNAFIGYMALRMMFVGGRYLTPDEAWERLGSYGGDDGLTADVDPRVYERAAAMMGQVLTSNIVLRGRPGVEFLGRVFSDSVWTGDKNSCIDVGRQLAKFHLCVSAAGLDDPLSKLTERLRSYALTDPNTPVLGEFVKRALELGVACTSDQGTVHDMASWWAQFDRSEQFPNENVEGWMEAYVLRTLPHFDFAGFRAWLAGVKQPSELLTPPLFAVPPTTVAPVATLVVDDVLLLSQGLPIRLAKETKDTKSARKPKDKGERAARKKDEQGGGGSKQKDERKREPEAAKEPEPKQDAKRAPAKPRATRQPRGNRRDQKK